MLQEGVAMTNDKRANELATKINNIIDRGDNECMSLGDWVEVIKIITPALDEAERRGEVKIQTLLRQWKKYARGDGKEELLCKHGVGHGGIHGCDGCCNDPSFDIAWKWIFGEKHE